MTSFHLLNNPVLYKISLLLFIFLGFLFALFVQKQLFKKIQKYIQVKRGPVTFYLPISPPQIKVPLRVPWYFPMLFSMNAESHLHTHIYNCLAISA